MCYGVWGQDLLLFKSYFQNRKQYVSVNDEESFIGFVDYGVSQGSGFGPLLFPIYLNDLKDLNLSGQLFMFVDDASIYDPYKYGLSLVGCVLAYLT